MLVRELEFDSCKPLLLLSCSILLLCKKYTAEFSLLLLCMCKKAVVLAAIERLGDSQENVASDQIRPKQG